MRSFTELLHVLHFIIVFLKIAIRISNYFYRNLKRNQFKYNFSSCFVAIHKYIQILISKVHEFNNPVIHRLLYPMSDSILLRNRLNFRVFAIYTPCKVL